MATSTITFTDHLIQSTLADALKTLVGDDNWIGTEQRVPGTRRRWDMMFRWDGETFVVEFDGDQHYHDSLVMRADAEKDRIADELGYITIRIPYFVQLTTQTLKHYFGIDADIVQEFPHGFVKS
ncbi:MAG: hypothetical protein ACYCOU_15310, partial [Sulfobacillus sp.]